MIHRLMAETFLPNPDNLPEIDHIDGNALNNNLDNLRWVTRFENNNNPITLSNLKLSVRDISKPVLQLKNGAIVKEYNSINEAAKKTDFPQLQYVRYAKEKEKIIKVMWRYKNEKA